MRLVSRYCIHVIQILRGPIGDEGVGTDQYGEPLDAATPTMLTLYARVEFDNARVINNRGEEIPCAAYVFIPHWYVDPATGEQTELTIGGQDRIVFEGRTYAIARSDRQEEWSNGVGRHWGVWIH